MYMVSTSLSRDVDAENLRETKKFVTYTVQESVIVMFVSTCMMNISGVQESFADRRQRTGDAGVC